MTYEKILEIIMNTVAGAFGIFCVVLASQHFPKNFKLFDKSDK